MLRNAVNRARNIRRDEGGFTLIELLIVIVILGVLAAIVVFSVRGITDRGEDSACKTEYRTIVTAIEAWAADDTAATAGAPADIDALVTGNFLADAPEGADGPTGFSGATAIGADYELPTTLSATCP